MTKALHIKDAMMKLARIL